LNLVEHRVMHHVHVDRVVNLSVATALLKLL
jgi:hypothetical protein